METRSKESVRQIDRGRDEEQERHLAELKAAEVAENFPSGGSLILAESSAHALEIAEEMRAGGHRAIARGVYVRTTATAKAMRRGAFARGPRSPATASPARRRS